MRAAGASEVDVVCTSVDVLGVESELFVEDIKRVQLSLPEPDELNGNTSEDGQNSFPFS